MSRTFVRSALGARVGLAALSLLGVALGSTRPAMALSQADFEGTALETICQDACVGLPALDGSDLTFPWAVRARVDDLDIRLHTTGRVHLLGPIRATGSVTLLSDTSIAVMDGVAIDVGETLTISTLGDLDLLSGEITIGPDRIDLDEPRADLAEVVERHAIGLDGAVLLAYIIAIPANEIVIPTILMLSVLGKGAAVGAGAGVIFQLDSLHATGELLRQAGWTLQTAVSLMLFSLIHNPCSTTIYTMWKETRSARWTAVAALLPLLLGFVVTFFVTQVWRLFG